MKSLISKITDSELRVMKVLWSAGGELTAADILKTLEKSSDWESSTIKTLLRRLCDKGAVISAKKEVLYYKPVVSEEQYNNYSTQVLIDRLYAGSAKNLVASLIDNKKLDDKDIDELRQLFKEGDSDERNN